ncbi:hypothetical protein Bhyg_09195 [Pseudolycoriella hygida]|uniref:IgA peptidase M64 n=1 Tax=Pseudolycoriella hygida TaxID=35572 RepID=A0A9Q0N621_9DIPT|nr:hypothetical protein Bhyg_09195 [Pseudolycoriella hygida]
MKNFIWTFLLFQVIAATEKAYHTKLRQSPQENYKCLILEPTNFRTFKGFKASDAEEIKIFSKPATFVPSEASADDSKIIEIYAKSFIALEAYSDSICKSIELVASISMQDRQTREGLQVEDIVYGGNVENRIDVVFMGDGYTADERDQFFADIRRLTDDMFNGDTFRSYLPLFNIWAVYVESVESGIAYNGPTKDTAFRLYRNNGQLRGVFTANAQFARQVCQEMGPAACDYPSIIGNDDYYGGLEGEFVISTKSSRTGTVVLRHEMGHNFVSVGEEYDNGSSYFGVNSATTLAQAITKWGHWLSGENIREERAIFRLLAYPWADLSLGEQSFTFTSDGQHSRWYILVSVSAAGEEDSLEFVLDGVVLSWQTRGSDDREFYDWRGDEGFSLGAHSFIVRSVTPSTNPYIPRMICSITIHEFGNEEEFSVDNDVVSAYPTWDVARRVTYRPTNAGCLMRNMTSTSFCSVCKEGMWYQFLQRISLIDEVRVSKTPNADRTKRVVLNTLKLGQLREPGNEVDNETLQVRWSQGGRERPEFDDLFEIDAEAGVWSVFVRFLTSEVRYDPDGLLQDVEHFTVTLPANSTITNMN